jgi:hypothetical protein
MSKAAGRRRIPPGTTEAAAGERWYWNVNGVYHQDTKSTKGGR